MGFMSIPVKDLERKRQALSPPGRPRPISNLAIAIAVLGRRRSWQKSKVCRQIEGFLRAARRSDDRDPEAITGVRVYRLQFLYMRGRQTFLPPSRLARCRASHCHHRHCRMGHRSPEPAITFSRVLGCISCGCGLSLQPSTSVAAPLTVIARL